MRTLTKGLAAGAVGLAVLLIPGGFALADDSDTPPTPVCTAEEGQLPALVARAYEDVIDRGTLRWWSSRPDQLSGRAPRSRRWGCSGDGLGADGRQPGGRPGVVAALEVGDLGEVDGAQQRRRDR